MLLKQPRRQSSSRRYARSGGMMVMVVFVLLMWWLTRGGTAGMDSTRTDVETSSQPKKFDWRDGQGGEGFDGRDGQGGKGFDRRDGQGGGGFDVRDGQGGKGFDGRDGQGGKGFDGRNGQGGKGFNGRDGQGGKGFDGRDERSGLDQRVERVEDVRGNGFDERAVAGERFERRGRDGRVEVGNGFEQRVKSVDQRAEDGRRLGPRENERGEDVLDASLEQSEDAKDVVLENGLGGEELEGYDLVSQNQQHEGGNPVIQDGLIEKQLDADESVRQNNLRKAKYGQEVVDDFVIETSLEEEQQERYVQVIDRLNEQGNQIVENSLDQKDELQPDRDDEIIDKMDAQQIGVMSEASLDTEDEQIGVAGDQIAVAAVDDHILVTDDQVEQRENVVPMTNEDETFQQNDLLNDKNAAPPQRLRRNDDSSAITIPPPPPVLDDATIRLMEILKPVGKGEMERRLAFENQPDFGNPVFDEEAALLIAQVEMEPNISVKESIALMTRPGHRRRLTDTIGGKPMDLMESRESLASNTATFVYNKDSRDPAVLRDYKEHPVQIKQAHTQECIVPCGACDEKCDTTLESVTMENVDPLTDPDPFAVIGSCWLNSKVPLPYFSWHDFGILKPAIPKTPGNLAAAFISNCGRKPRETMLTGLLNTLGSSVVSFGRCLTTSLKLDGRTQDDKLSTLKTFKFSLAFENSETIDYATEKFFGTLASGSVPVTMGPPNIKFFAPDSGPYPYETLSVVRTRDFGDDPVEVARVLDALDKDDDAYERMLAYKTNGYSVDYKALIDLTNVHSSCRICIYVADQRRNVFGANAYDNRVLNVEKNREAHSTFFYIRERGTYRLVELGFREISFVELIRKILSRLVPTPINLWKDNDDLRKLPYTRVYGLYVINSRRPVLCDQDLAQLPNGAELEIIFA